MKWSPAWQGFIVEAGDERELEVLQEMRRQVTMQVAPYETMKEILFDGATIKEIVIDESTPLPPAQRKILDDMEVGQIDRVNIVETPEVIEHFDPTVKRNRSDGERMQDLVRAAALGVRDPQLRKPPPLSDRCLCLLAAGVRKSDEARVNPLNPLYGWVVMDYARPVHENRGVLTIAPMEGFRSSGVIFGAIEP